MSKLVFSNTFNQSNTDRFIPNRSKTNFELNYFKLCSSARETSITNDIFNQKLGNFHRYQELIKKTIDFNETPILAIRNITNKSNKKEDRKRKVEPHWPVKPREYPVLIKTPEIVLDLPNIEPEIYWNIVDWSSTGYLATIWTYKVYLWKARNDCCQEVLETGISAYGALRWNHAGTLLAVGNQHTMNIWMLPKKKLMYESRCCENCKMSVFAWDMTDKYLIGGCSQGMLTIWKVSSVNTEPELSLYGHNNCCVISLVFCNSNRFVCSSGADSLIRIWHWPRLDTHVEIEYCSPVRAIAFHPWQPGLLAIGGGVGDGSLTIWNVKSCTQIGYMKPFQESFVDCLTWSTLSGELVTSHQIIYSENEQPRDPSKNSYTQIVVLARLDLPVDYIEEHQGRVLYLMWDKTGTKLATASSDDNLCIWNFLGKNYKKKNLETKKKTKWSLLQNFDRGIR